MPVGAPLWADSGADRKLKNPFCAGTSGARRVAPRRPTPAATPCPRLRQRALAPGVERRATLHPWGWTHAAGRGRVRFIGVPQGESLGTGGFGKLGYGLQAQ